ncbi:glutathione peroxidase [Bradyrhizobium sp. 147]|uniref:glutathione peroxidase n=1 Tax=unclassified Bradyrhizobium TaxID=2631580 RepID=UPI001FF8C5BF|nr:MULTISPECIES: glutathione peroxidase [unclassified Bradyrhizobium]MCK1545365.1 glutathione peroxidase [Bradyrhizobium sp. 179]MCK1622175.1 glutathione peroxidase [Bradyrhizobium sp. 160]MCK1681540.1 glutathione peroxidase [Bradyrhizobium sp. 147]
MMNRRTMLGALAGALVPMTRAFADGGMSRISAYAFSFPALSGENIRLAAYTGKPLLVVNTASLCGYTPQYAGLQELWDEFRERGLTVIGVPSNDFGGQEPGGASEISETAHHQYGVSFPITAKSVVIGSKAHPFYKWAADARPREVPKWNFHKYLTGRDGYIAEVFASAVAPTDTRVKMAIAKALADT